MTVANRLVDRVTRERLATKRRRQIRRMWSFDDLPATRAFFYGPKWKRLFGVQEVPIAQVHPEAAKYHRPGRKLLMFTLEDDVREMVQEEIRPGVFAEWSDPRERLPIVRPKPTTQHFC